MVFEPTRVDGGTVVPSEVKNEIVFDNATINLDKAVKLLGGSYKGTIQTITTYSITPDNITFGEGVALSDDLVKSINKVLGEMSGGNAGYSLGKNGKKWEIKQGDVVTVTAKTDGTTPIKWLSINGDKTGLPAEGTSETVLAESYVTLEHSGVQNPNYEFKGWYVGNSDSPVYTYNPYTFEADETATYVAKFGLRASIAKFVNDAASWYTENAEGNNTVSIDNTDDMNYFAAAVAAGKSFSGKTVTLAADLDYSGKECLAVGDADHAFCGTFDGQNKTIKNIAADKVVRLKDSDKQTHDSFAGLFAKLSYATVKNLTLENCSFTQDVRQYTYSGGIAAKADNSAIENCTVKNVTTKGWFNSPVVGHTDGGLTVQDVTVKDCTPGGDGGCRGGAVVGYSCGATIAGVMVTGVNAYANGRYAVALIGYANAGKNEVGRTVVNAPNSALFGPIIVNSSEGGVVLSGGENNITAKSIMKSTDESKTITIEGGTFDLSTVDEGEKNNLTIFGGTYTIDVTDYVDEGKLLKVTTEDGGLLFTVVNDDEKTEGTYTTPPSYPADGYIVRKDDVRRYTVVQDDAGAVTEGTYVTQPTGVPDGYVAVKNSDNTWTVKAAVVTENKDKKDESGEKIGTVLTVTETSTTTDNVVTEVKTETTTVGETKSITETTTISKIVPVSGDGTKNRTVTAVVEIKGEAAKTVTGVYAAAMSAAPTTGDDAERDYKLKLTVEKATETTADAQGAITEAAKSEDTGVQRH